MNRFGSRIPLLACVAVGFLAPAGCSEGSGGAPPGADEDASAEFADAGEVDSQYVDASTSDVVNDRRIKWDSGPEVEAPVVEEMWARGSVYCARLKRSGVTTMECWGNNTSGELGRGQVSQEGTTFKPFPIASAEAATFKKIANNGSFLNGVTCAVTANDDLKCWGRSYDGVSPPQPSVPDEPFLTDIADVDMVEESACALSTSGHVACWGGNMNGQLGLGTTDYVNHPVPEEIPNFTAEQVVCGATTTCAVKSGEVWCWGSIAQLGNGMGFGWNATPGRVLGLSNIKKVQMNQYTTFALANDKTLWFWGILGSTTAYTPMKVLDPTPDDPNHVLSDVEDIAGGCVRLTNGKVRCLASSGAYEFNEIPRVKNTSLLRGSCALSSAGELRCWGHNTVGQLGLPPTVLSMTTSSMAIEF
jgi:Regulator of chromosome condensation (RCC1) repeat